MYRKKHWHAVNESNVDILDYVWYSFEVVYWLDFEKSNWWFFLSKYVAVMQKVKQELSTKQLKDRLRGDTFVAVKILKPP